MFSAQCRYAIRVTSELVKLSVKVGKVSGIHLADCLDMPKPFLLKILQDLVRNNLISSSKGPGGGFYMKEENLNRPLIEFIEINECNQAFNSCVLGLTQCSSKNPCAIHHIYAPFINQFRNKLTGMQVKDLLTEDIIS